MARLWLRAQQPLVQGWKEGGKRHSQQQQQRWAQVPLLLALLGLLQLPHLH